MRPLTDGNRRCLFALSAVLCATPLVFAPLAAESSFEVPAEKNALAPPHELHLPARLKSRAVVIARDPFVADREPAAPQSETAPSGNDVPAVRALVTGQVPYALVDLQGVLHIVRAGDRITGSVVTRIDAAGVHMQDGRNFALAESRP